MFKIGKNKRFDSSLSVMYYRGTNKRKAYNLMNQILNNTHNGFFGSFRVSIKNKRASV